MVDFPLLIRRRLRSWQRASRLSLYVLACLCFLDVFWLLGAHRTFSKNLAFQTIHHVRDLPREAASQQIYIAAQFWSSERVLLQFWVAQFLKVVRTLGPENVYVSILESGSLDNTADAIRWLDEELGKLNVQRTVATDPATHEDLVNSGPLDEYGREKPGWIETGQWTSPGQKEMRRIPYLADVRNQGLEPLQQMHANNERSFDKILYLNDVYFEPSDILTLLATNYGHYDVACGIDFHYPPAFYDTFVLRDGQGNGPVQTTFPYFRYTEERSSMLRGHPVRVSSCWNGILVVDAAPYYDQIDTNTSSTTDTIPGLRFRGLADSLAVHHLEASECCLIHADLLASGQARKGIFLNPAVRTGYTVEAYRSTHTGADKGFVSRFQYVSGVWKNRFLRWKVKNVSGVGGQDMGAVSKRTKKWREEGVALGEMRSEVGSYCAIDEMQILVGNGWKHI